MDNKLYCSFPKQRKELEGLIKQIKKLSWKQLKNLQSKIWPPIKVVQIILTSQHICQNCILHKSIIKNIHQALFALIGMGLTSYQLGNQKYIDDTCNQILTKLQSTDNTYCLAQ